MRTLFACVVVMAAGCLLLTGAQAGDKEKAVTLKGKITCAKCDLGATAECATVIVAKDKDKKDVTYYFDTTSGKKYHKEICTDAKQGTVVGVVSEKGDKKIVTVQKLTFDK
jgi:hypothetical protein